MNGPTAEPGPSVSVVLPVLNERATITDCLASIAAQDYPHIIEVLVVDGSSSDGTREIVLARGGSVRLVDNPKVTAASAMNVGIAVAKGDVICRADAHTVYDRGYVSNCVRVLGETGASNVGGRMRPVGTTSFGRAVAAVTSSPFGVGPGHFHYADRRMEVDTVYLGCWRAELLRALGGYDDEVLQWAAEDQELNFRIRRAGGSVLLDPAVVSYYFPRETPRALWRQYRNYGVAKASTLAKHRRLPTWRPLVPGAMVAVAVALFVKGRGPVRVVVPATHAMASFAVALHLSDDPGVAPHRAALALGICHWSYGVGFWEGLARIAIGRPFDVRPEGHR